MDNTSATLISEPYEITYGAKKATAGADVENVASSNPVHSVPVRIEANRKLEANLPNDSDYDIWLPLASVHEVNDRIKNSLLLKEDLSCVPVWVKFHDVPLVAYTSDGSSLIATKIVMAVPNLEGTGYMKETIRVEYEWKPPRCSTGLIFGHLLDDCPKAPKRVVNMMDKDDDGKHLKKVDYSGDQDSEDEIKSVDNEMASYLASKPSGVGYDTKSLLEQWRETYVNDDYDPYDDDMYEGHNIPKYIQSVCDNLDIMVRGRMKK
ncbi:hypothetical protein Tco_0830431 [Tanacetum coccineum]